MALCLKLQLGFSQWGRKSNLPNRLTNPFRRHALWTQGGTLFPEFMQAMWMEVASTGPRERAVQPGRLRKHVLRLTPPLEKRIRITIDHKTRKRAVCNPMQRPWQQ